MTLITLNQVSQVFGGSDIFKNVSARLERGARVGLVGRNGVGKTSLLRLIAQTDTPNSGKVEVVGGTRIGYLHQEAMQAFGDQNGTLMEGMLAVFESVHGMEKRLRELELILAEDADAMIEYGDLLEQYEAAGGYDFPNRIEQTLSGLGFGKADYDTPLQLLSGGQKTRALLARLLLEAPDVLMLDEPTNHLDVEAIRWLETLLRNWTGTLLIVSHDRYFLDVVVDHIWELTVKGLDSYKGNYTAYLRQREERRERAGKIFTQEMERMTQEIEFIRKNIARPATNDNAVGRLRRLSREIVAIQEMGVIAYSQNKSWLESGIGGVRPFTVGEAEKALKALPHPVEQQKRMQLALRKVNPSSSVVLRTDGLSVGYPDRKLFDTQDIVLVAGECAALIGGNGIGKTTFLRTLRQEIAPLHGTLKYGHQVQIGYFAQAHQNLIAENSVLDELMRHKPRPMSEARALLARYLFRNDDVHKPISALSGGERAKLALAILASEGANLLVLDEPTNHLDIPSQEALQDVLEDFEGTILMVTHDRYLVDRLATQIWTVESGLLNVYQGTYREYLAADRQMA